MVKVECIYDGTCDVPKEIDCYPPSLRAFQPTLKLRLAEHRRKMIKASSCFGGSLYGNKITNNNYLVKKSLI